MGSVFNVLKKIEKYPGMYIGYDDEHPGARLSSLEAMLMGYAQALQEHGVSEPGLDFMHTFAEYLRGRYGWSMSCGPIAAIYMAYPDEKQAWQMFWKLVWEFRDTLATAGNGGKGGGGAQGLGG
jgi:hypothetical protein